MNHYIDLDTLYSGEVGVYCRVSTAGQNINQQISLAELYFTQKDINKDKLKVKYFLDNSISANKLSLEKRPALKNLLIEIQQGKIKTVVVQSRDRLARNFYEYMDLVKVFYKYNVKVLFTGSGQPEFSKILSFEALYGIFAQSEGSNIASRTNLSARQFPNSIWGFNVIGKRKEKKYKPNPEVDRVIKSLFYSVINVNSAEELIGIFNDFKKVLKKDLKLLACLKNPFYAGHIKIDDQYVPLPHVEPIILLEEYLKVQESILKYKQELEAAIAIANEKGLVHPICNCCKNEMSTRSGKFGEGAYYVCNKKGHSRVSLEVSRYNQLILEHLTYVLNKINVKELKKDVFKSLLDKEKQLKKQISFKENQLDSYHKKIIELLADNRKGAIDKALEQTKLIEEDMKELHSRLIQINDARTGINDFVQTVKDQLIHELQIYQKEFLTQQLFSKIEISSDSIIYHTNFGNYIEGVEME